MPCPRARARAEGPRIRSVRGIIGVVHGILAVHIMCTGVHRRGHGLNVHVLVVRAAGGARTPTKYKYKYRISRSSSLLMILIPVLSRCVPITGVADACQTHYGPLPVGVADVESEGPSAAGGGLVDRLPVRGLL